MTHRGKDGLHPKRVTVFLLTRRQETEVAKRLRESGERVLARGRVLSLAEALKSQALAMKKQLERMEKSSYWEHVPTDALKLHAYEEMKAGIQTFLETNAGLEATLQVGPEQFDAACEAAKATLVRQESELKELDKAAQTVSALLKETTRKRRADTMLERQDKRKITAAVQKGCSDTVPSSVQSLLAKAVTSSASNMTELENLVSLVDSPFIVRDKAFAGKVSEVWSPWSKSFSGLQAALEANLSQQKEAPGVIKSFGVPVKSSDAFTRISSCAWFQAICAYKGGNERMYEGFLPEDAAFMGLPWLVMLRPKSCIEGCFGLPGGGFGVWLHASTGMIWVVCVHIVQLQGSVTESLEKFDRPSMTRLCNQGDIVHSLVQEGEWLYCPPGYVPWAYNPMETSVTFAVLPHFSRSALTLVEAAEKETGEKLRALAADVAAKARNSKAFSRLQGIVGLFSGAGSE